MHERKFYVTPLGGRIEIDVKKITIDLTALSDNELNMLSTKCAEEIASRYQDDADGR